MDEKRPQSREYYKGLLTGALVFAAAVLAVLLFRYGTLGRPRGAAEALTDRETQEKIRLIADLIDEGALKEPSAQELKDYMLRGVAAGLDDPYAAYYSAREMEEVAKQTAGTYYGIGVVFTQEEAGQIAVQSVYPDSPAAAAGVRAGDILSGIGETGALDFSLEAAADKIADILEEKKKVSLTFQRDGQERKVTVKAAAVETAKVTSSMLGEKTGYIRIPEFDEVTLGQFEKALSSLQEQDLANLIVDVRDNPGGLLDTVSGILDDLLGECVLLTTRTRGGEGERIEAEEGTLFDGKLAVLVNGASASASEVFSGVLQYYKKAVVIGAATYGKGTVQKTWSFQDGSAFKMTTEAYAIAGEKEIEGTGVQPDIPVEANDNADGTADDNADGPADLGKDKAVLRALEYFKTGK